MFAISCASEVETGNWRKTCITLPELSRINWVWLIPPLNIGPVSIANNVTSVRSRI